MPKGCKTCVCGAVVRGPRTLTCPECGTSLKKERSEVESVAETSEAAIRTVFSFPDGYNIPNSKLLLVHIPNGTPPIRLRCAEGETFPGDDTLIQWAGDVRQAMIHQGKYIKNPGLVYWARHEINADHAYPPGGDEMKYVGLIIGNMPDITTREIPA